MYLADICRDAAQLISERGHTKGRNIDDQGRLCWQGALGIAGMRNVFHCLTITNATNAILIRDHGWNYGPVGWNDRSDTTGEDVILLLKQTAEFLDTRFPETAVSPLWADALVCS